MVTKEDMKKSLDGRFPIEWYEILNRAEVAIAGLGGLGSHIAVMLARSGIGKLHLVDFDVVDISNLNRQEYDVRHIGIKKTEALTDRLKEINPYVKITSDDIRITLANAAYIFSGYPIVCEAFDKAEEKAMLISTLLSECKDTVIVSGNGMAGLGDANGIKTRKAGYRLYICGDESTDIGEGVGLMAPRVSVCAGHQANQVIRIILEKEGIVL